MTLKNITTSESDQSNAITEESFDKPFWDHKDVSLVDFLEHVDTTTAERFCATFERLRQAVCCERPGMPREGVNILHQNARPHIASWMSIGGQQSITTTSLITYS